MRKKFTMLLALLLACVGVMKAQTAEIVASTNVECPENQYAMKSGNGYWMTSFTSPTNTKPGKFAFFAVDGKEDTYQIYSVDRKKWVSYTLAGSYSNATGIATLVDNQADAQGWKAVVKQRSGEDFYQFAPYNTTGVASQYMNWFEGTSSNALDNETTTVGLWQDNATNDAGSAWSLSKLIVPTTGTEYVLKDLCHNTYLDIHNLGFEPNSPTDHTKLATVQDEWQPLYITVSENGWKWKIHTTAEGGNYLHQSSTRSWNSWVSEGGQEFIWIAELAVANGNLAYALRHESGTENGYLGADTHTNGNALYVNQSDAAKKLKLTLIEAEEMRSIVTVTYNFTYKGEIKYTQETEVLKGESYPELNYSAPWGIRVATTKPEGTVSSSIVETIELVDTEELPFKYADSYANIMNWYYMPFHSSNRWYLGYTEDQENIPLNDAAKTLPAEGQDAYLWAFVGNPFDGYKIVNKAAGEAMILSSSTTISGDGADTYPLLTEESNLPEGNNTYWIPTASTHATNGFFLAQKGYANNRMNARSNKLAYWTGGADAGSTFQVTTLADFANYDIADLLADAGKVGYPKTTSSAYTTLNSLEGGRATVLDVELAISAYKKSTDIALPENGKAYQLAFVANDDNLTKYNIIASNTSLSASSTAEATTFYCVKNTNADGQERYAFVSPEGYFLGYNTLTADYKTHIGDDKRLQNDFAIASLVGVTSQYIAPGTEEKRLGTVSLTATNRILESQDKAGCLILKFSDSNLPFDKTDAPYYNGTYTSAIKFTEVTDYEVSNDVLVAASTVAPLIKGYIRVGEGIGKYAYTYGENTGRTFADFEALVNAATAVIADQDYSFAINMPAAGFYRIKSMNGNDANKKGKYWQSNEAGSTMELAASKDEKRSIIYIDEDNKFVSYGCGDYLNHHSNITVAAEGKAWSILENAQVVGTYALDYPDDGNWCLSDWTGGATFGHNDANAAWIFEEVVSLPVAVSAVGFATLYAPVALEIPEGVTAYIGTVIGDWLTLTEIEDVIPAGTGVILASVFAEGDEKVAKEFSFTIATAIDNMTSALKGHEAAHLTSSVTGTPYTLQSNGEGGVVFKKYTGTNLNGFKSYLVLPENTEAQALRIRFAGEEDDATGIEGSALDAQGSQLIYDLQGRRVQNPTKGMYIVNGKKVVIR